MIIYIYNEQTRIYEYSKEAQKSPREENKYLFPTNSTTIKPPEYNIHERPYFINNSWILQPYYVGFYQVEIETKFISKINYVGNIKTGYQLLSDVEVEDITKYPQHWIQKNNKLVKLSDKEYEILSEIKNIDILVNETAIAYNNYIEKPILYSNGFTYKPLYAKDSYQSLFNAEKIAKELGTTTFPQYIKDSTKLLDRAVSMNYEELSKLSLFLGQLDGNAWRLKADKEAELILKRSLLEKELEELRK